MTWLSSGPLCPQCGRPHQDGVNVIKDGKDLFICLDCAEKGDDEPGCDVEPDEVF